MIMSSLEINLNKSTMNSGNLKQRFFLWDVYCR